MEKVINGLLDIIHLLLLLLFVVLFSMTFDADIALPIRSNYKRKQTVEMADGRIAMIEKVTREPTCASSWQTNRPSPTRKKNKKKAKQLHRATYTE